jgi:hypothetical protein
VLPLLLAITVLLVAAPPALAGPDPIDHDVPPAPDGTPVCAEWVHDRSSCGGARELANVAPAP